MQYVARFVLLSIALGAAASCDDSPVSPVSGPGELFVLRTIDGDALPAPAVVTDGYALELVADSLLLRPDGTGREVRVGRQTSSGVTEQVREIVDFEYTRVGDSIAVTVPCNDGLVGSASCIAPPHYAGRRTPDGISFDFWVGFQTPMVFELVRTLEE